MTYIPRKIKSYFFTSPVGSSGTYYKAGFYDLVSADANLTQASTTVTLGSANHPYAAHAFIVSGGNGTTDGSDLVLTVSGTSITDAGVRATSDTQVVVADGTTLVDVPQVEAHGRRSTDAAVMRGMPLPIP